MKKNFAKLRLLFRPTGCCIAALSAIALAEPASADSYVDVDGFRYRLNINPQPAQSEWPVSAVLTGALDWDAVSRGAHLPDYAYADGVQYPVIGIDGSAYSGFYGTIEKVTYNKFCNPEPWYYDRYTSAGAGYLTSVRITSDYHQCQFDGWNKLRSIVVDYSLDTHLINLYSSQKLEKISLPAFTDSHEFRFHSQDILDAHKEANLGFCMSGVSFETEKLGAGDYDIGLTIRCAAPVPPSVSWYLDDRTNVEIHVPVGTAAAYREAEGWTRFADNIYEDIDYAYNYVGSYVEYDGLYYSIMYDEYSSRPCASVIGPVDRNCTSVNVAGSIYWNYQSVPVKKIGPCAFMECKNITSFYLPEGLEVIEDMAFYGCRQEVDYNPVRIYLPETIKEVGKKAFAGGSKLAGHRMPESLKRIDDYGFDGALPDYELSYIDLRYRCVALNDGLEYIGDCAFASNHGLLSVAIPSSVSYIGRSAFCLWTDHPTLNEMEFRGGYSEILGMDGARCLYAEAELTLPSGLKSLSPYSVAARSVVVGDDVTKILPHAMQVKDELWMLPETPPTAYESSFFDNAPNLTLHVRRHCLNRYAIDPVWGKFGNIVADIDWVDVNHGDWRFKVDRFNNTAELTGYNGDSWSAEKLVVPSEVTLDGVAYPVETIGKFAIAGVRGGCNIEIPASVKHIKNYAITDSSPEKVICKSTEPPVVDTEYPYHIRWPYSMDGMGYDDFTLCVPKGSVDVYKNSDFGKMFREVVEESQSGIDEVADSESVDGSLPVEVYSTGGVLIYRGVMADSLIPAGIYIIKQGSKVAKYIVK